MYESFKEKTEMDLETLFNTTADKSPISDVVDSYAMLCYGLEHYFKI